MNEPSFTEVSETIPPEPESEVSWLRVLGVVAGVYLFYAALRTFLPAANELWGLGLVFGFYWVPQYVMRHNPKFIEQELELQGQRGLIPKWNWSGVRWAWIVGLVVFPAFALGFWAFYDRVCAGDVQLLSPVLWLEGQTAFGGRLEGFMGHLCRSYRADFWPTQFRWPETFGQYFGFGWLLEITVGVFAIALPEEIFHRGFLQGSLEKRFPPRFSVFGVKMGAAAIACSAIFAVGHLVSLQETSRLATFFPSLLFGWLWRRSGTLWAPALFHAASNLLMDLLLASTFPGT